MGEKTGNGGMRLLGTVTWYYFRNYYRSKSFYFMVVITLLVSALLSYFSFNYVNRIGSIFPGANLTDIGTFAREQIFGYLWSFVLLDLPVFASVFFGSPAISSEIESKTAYHIFTLPIGRTKLFVSKYLAAVAATLLTVLIYVAVQAAVFISLFHGLLIYPFYESIGLLIVFIFAIVAFTFLISGIFDRNTYAYITVFLIYFLVFSAFQIIVEFLYRETPFYLLNVAASIVERVYININPDPFRTSFTFAPAGQSDILLSLAVIAMYWIVSLSAGIIMFERKEVK